MASVELSTPVTGPYTQPIGLFINNEFVESIEGKKIEVINPTSESVICSVHEATEKDVDLAVSVARQALQGVWKDVEPCKRGHLLSKLADLFEEKKELLSAVESLNNGKAFSMAKADITACVGILRYYAGWADKITGQVVDMGKGFFSYVRKEPIGVCGQIIPWNFPLPMWVWKVAPAIAAGNTVVLKTSEVTPLSALVACQLVVEAGFPAGVINVITGYGTTAGKALSHHMMVDKVAFTGSTKVGREILAASAASNLKKVILELGGKSPNIIFSDADMEKAVEWANFGIYFNQGQCCCAGSRIYVQDTIYDKFMHLFVERTRKNVVGNPFDPNTFQGPLVSKTQFTRVMGYIEDGKKCGAKIETGGKQFGTKGYFIEPTIFSNVKEDMNIVKQEIFGPVCVVNKFKTVNDVIRMANDTTYGLAAAVHTNNLNTAIQVSNELKAGTVWVNTYNYITPQIPFGGYKESGTGRELGEASLENYYQCKSVIIKLADAIFA